ncbi:MAG: serine kinase [Proteiniphilum sp.]|jgi:serine kinase of HPr protein (carbohydrate metabolism regulator)|nr:serine kinase [Proteiniphilum sp.]
MQTTLKQLIEEMNFECLSGKAHLERPAHAAYASDLLSDVMGKAQAGMLWVTSQVHKNIVAVASLKELSAIIVVNERRIDPEVLEHAEGEEVVIIASGLPAFETIGMLYKYLEKVKSEE